MGRDLGRRALTHGRAVLVGVALTTALLGATAAPAAADDVTPGAQPTPVSIPTVSPPSQQQIDDARNALARLQSPGASATPTGLTRVESPVDDGSGPVTARISSEGWWTIAAGAMVLLVASESTRLGVRRAKHRKRA